MRLRRLQTKKLVSAVSFAYERVPMYHQMFRRLGLRPEDVRSVEDLARLPTSSKEDVLKGQEDVMRGRGTAGIRIHTTSGTTGRPASLAGLREAYAITRALGFRKMTQLGIRPWSRVATLWAPQKYWRRTVSGGVERPMTGLYDLPVIFRGRTLANIMTLWVNPSDPGGDGRRLASFNPQFIYGRPSYLRAMARHGGPGLGIRPKVIVATGEIVTETGLRELRNAFDAKVVRSLGAAPVGSIAGECTFERGLHLWEDFKVFEILKDGEAVSPGEVGELVVTSLYRDVIPLIRFSTGDMVRLGESDRCECGCCMTRLSAVEGRANDHIIGRDGERFLALAVSDRLESDYGLRDFQLLQTGLSEFRLLLPEDVLVEGDKISAVTRYLEELTGTRIRLEVARRSMDDYWTKTRPVICKVPTPVEAPAM